MKKVAIFLYSVFLLASCSKNDSNTSAPVNNGSWNKVADLNADILTGNAFSVNNKGFVIYKKSFYQYDPAANQWTKMADFPGPLRTNGAIAFSIGNKGYYGLGKNIDGTTTTYLNDFWEYDPSTDKWTQKANYPVYMNYAKGLGIGAEGFVVGGIDSSNVLHNDLYQYDPLTDSWLPKAAFPGGIRMSMRGFETDTKGYFGFGGTQIDAFTDLWEYDPGSDHWTAKAPLPSINLPTILISISGKGYTYGGSYVKGTQEIFTRDIYQFDPVTNTWSTKAGFPADGRYTTVAFSLGNKGYIGPGFINSGSSVIYYHDVWQFVP